MFMVYDPMGNRVVLWEQTWLNHTAPKRNDRFEKLPDLGDVRASVLNPDQIRRSLHPEIGWCTAIFEKFIEDELLQRR